MGGVDRTTTAPEGLVPPGPTGGVDDDDVELSD